MDDQTDRGEFRVRGALPQALWDLADLCATTDESAALRQLDRFRELAEVARRAARRDLALARLEMALRAGQSASA
jgi:hypothetical protein